MDPWDIAMSRIKQDLGPYGFYLLVGEKGNYINLKVNLNGVLWLNNAGQQDEME